MKEKYKGVQILTDNPFLNLYHIDAIDTDGKGFNYYFASRNKENDIKMKTHDVKPEGIVIYGDPPGQPPQPRIHPRSAAG